MKNKLLASVGIFVFVGLALLAINHYVYSWIGRAEATVGLCEKKQVGLNDLTSSRGISLNEVIDLKKLASETILNSDYKTDLRGDYALYLERKFDNKTYQLLLENQNPNEETWIKFSEEQQNQVKESCYSPSYWMLKNAYKMIDDLPVTNMQKEKIKADLKVQTSIHLSLG
jgi:Protein of unknown function (DUF3908)